MTPEQIQEHIGSAKLYPDSVQAAGTETFAFVKDGAQHYLLIFFDPQQPSLHRDNFSGEIQDLHTELAVKWCLPSYANAAKLRALFPWTAPQTIGLKKSFGAGDRLGLAAAAHIRAARSCDEDGIALILAQQSIREMTRTQRTPADVLDAATWGAFRENYRQPWGADADHLKTEDDIRNMAAAGFTFFTIDPSENVDDNVQEYSAEELAAQFAALENNETLLTRYAAQKFEVPGENGTPLFVEFSRETLMRAAVKYARAVDHTVRLAGVLDEVKGSGNYELEMSVDETETPTSVAEHYFLARELRDRGVQVDSLAIRFVGEFQKGIDYIGDLDEFEARLKEHVLIARQFGPYKISVHSGSDKYSAYPILGRVCGELIHVKTAGTWYLEALRTAARCDIPLFREICDFAAGRFMTDRATYHVAKNLDDLPDYKSMSDAELESLFDNNTFRQMLHVTFGSVLTDKKENGGWHFRARVFSMLNQHEDEHLKIIEEYSAKHLHTLGWCQS
jgi:hypothetical protein